MIERKPIYGFWVSPDGVIYTIENDFGHKKLIEELLKEQFDSDESAVSKSLDDGWVRIVNMNKTYMIDYKYVCSTKQLNALKEVNDIMENNGYFHDNYSVSCYSSYKIFNSFKEMMRYIRERI